MAIVKVGQIKKSLDKAIKYITKPGKTQDGWLVSASWLMPFADQLKEPKTMADAMNWDNKRSIAGIRSNTTLARHVIQSFDPDDPLTPGMAHSIGIQFAHQLSDQGDYKYVIATHVDRAHLHNHIILCNTNSRTHYKMRLDKTTLMKRWTPISDKLCQEYGLALSPRHNQEEKHAAPTRWLRGADYYASLKGEGQKQRVRDMIDRACTDAHTFLEFKKTLRDYQVECSIRGTHLTYTDLTSGRKYRDGRLGVAYDERSVMVKLNHQALKHISVNQRLIDYEDPETMRIIIPHTRGDKRITIPKSMTTRAGKTVRVYFGQDGQIPVSDRGGHGAGKLSMMDLYASFGAPAETWRDLTHPAERPGREETPIVANTPRQAAWMRHQQQITDQIARQAKAITLINQAGGGDAGKAAATITRQLMRADDALTGLMIARQDLIGRLAARDDQDDQSQAQLDGLDKQLDTLSQAITTLDEQLRTLSQAARDQRRETSQERKTTGPRR